MPISSASTLAEIEAAILDNEDYEATASLAKAREFARACKAWLLRVPGSSASGGRSLTMNAQMVADWLARAQAYIDAAVRNRAGLGVKFLGADTSYR